jgi:ABC-type phosphate/phosphonate transport system substrate-binding protein
MLSTYGPFGLRLAPLYVVALLTFLWTAAQAASAERTPEKSDASSSLTVVVMDPLALPLSCPCVQGYAQRKYEKLAERLESELKRSVKLVFNESLTAALREQAEGRADLVIGKQSVVLFDAAKNNIEMTPIAMLTGKDGKTTQTGLIVVPSADPAKAVADLKGYRIVFGPQECDEKHVAALTLLKESGVTPTGPLETSAACDEGACLILEAGPEKRGAALISSYAKPLLEGCGTVKKGDLRVVGETKPVPFIGAFTTSSVTATDRQRLRDVLLKVGADAELCVALETKRGFVPVDSPVAETAKKK